VFPAPLKARIDLEPLLLNRLSLSFLPAEIGITQKNARGRKDDDSKGPPGDGYPEEMMILPVVVMNSSGSFNSCLREIFSRHGFNLLRQNRESRKPLQGGSVPPEPWKEGKHEV
jgi:hypothetical protein